MLSSVCFVVFFALCGYNISANAVAQKSIYYNQMNPILVCPIFMLQACVWSLFWILCNKTVVLIKNKFQNKNGMNSYTNDEVAFLMKTQDSASLDCEPKKKENEIQTKQELYYRIFDRRNDILKNLYISSTGIFFSVFALTTLDFRLMICFIAGLLCIAMREFILRANVIPKCCDEQTTLTVKSRCIYFESALIVCLAALTIYMGLHSEQIMFTTVDLPQIYSQNLRLILCFLSFFSPFFIW